MDNTDEWNLARFEFKKYSWSISYIGAARWYTVTRKLSSKILAPRLYYDT